MDGYVSARQNKLKLKGTFSQITAFPTLMKQGRGYMGGSCHHWSPIVTPIPTHISERAISPVEVLQNHIQLMLI